MLSRNFRLQQVGDIDWLFRNYDFATVSRGLDELMLIDVSRGQRDTESFCATIQHIASRCFIPLTVGGGIRSFAVAQRYLRSGADKLLINTAFECNPELVTQLANHFGCQCIVAGIDFRSTPQGDRSLFVGNGEVPVHATMGEWVAFLLRTGAGEILFQSIDRDGTGMGLDPSVLSDLADSPECPCILMGGIGKSSQIVEAFQSERVDAVATANLFNFIGSAFLNSRQELIRSGINLPRWNAADFQELSAPLVTPKVG